MGVSVGISATQNHYDPTTNTSTVTVTVTGSWTDGSYNGYNPGGTITVNGQNIDFNSDFNYQAGVGRVSQSGSQILHSQTIVVQHGADGSLILDYNVLFNSGVSSGVVGASGSQYLDGRPCSNGGSIITDLPRPSGGDTGYYVNCVVRPHTALHLTPDNTIFAEEHWYTEPGVYTFKAYSSVEWDVELIVEDGYYLSGCMINDVENNVGGLFHTMTVCDTFVSTNARKGVPAPEIIWDLDCTIDETGYYYQKRYTASSDMYVMLGASSALQSSVIKITTPTRQGIVEKIDLALTADSSSGRSVVYAAISASNENAMLYHTSNTTVDDAHQLTTEIFEIPNTTNAELLVTFDGEGMKPGRTYYIYLWPGDNNAIATIQAQSCVATMKPTGNVYIDTGSDYIPYSIYIDDGTQWSLYRAYIDTGDSWISCD
jgi:hypothetical protein